MKKLWITALLSALFISYALFVYAERREKVIIVEDLPQNVQQFIASHFLDEEVIDTRIVKYGFYKISLAGDYEALFDRQGKWMEITSDKNSMLPKLIIALLPQPSQNYLTQHYQNYNIYSIEKNRQGYEVKIDGEKEMKIFFDHKGNLIDEVID